MVPLADKQLQSPGALSREPGGQLEVVCCSGTARRTQRPAAGGTPRAPGGTSEISRCVEDRNHTDAK